MPIITNPSFDQQNQQLAKRPLYMLWIEGLPDPLTTFLTEVAQVTLSGYGVGGYGTTGYGR
jgi:hypothetical protein